jgi:hypothetical protein
MSAVFLLNAFKEHERFSKTKITSTQLRRLSLAGADNKHQRMLVYNFMLEYMSDDHRFDSLHRICTQILGKFHWLYILLKIQMLNKLFKTFGNLTKFDNLGRSEKQFFV